MTVWLLSHAHNYVWGLTGHDYGKFLSSYSVTERYTTLQVNILLTKINS